MEIPHIGLLEGAEAIDVEENTAVMMVSGKQYSVSKSINTSFKLERFVKRNGTKPSSMFSIAQKALNNSYPESFFYETNLKAPTSILNSGDQFYVPKRMRTHDTTTENTVVNNFTFPSGSYILNQPHEAEYAIMRMCSEMKRQGKCANFLEVLGFTFAIPSAQVQKDKSCGQIYDFILREKQELFHIGNGCNESLKIQIIESIAIQTLFAIYAMQRLHGIQHNNLHFGNIKLVSISEAYQFLSYEIDDIMIYLPNLGFVVKIDGFSYATKYELPMIVSKRLIDDTEENFPVPKAQNRKYDALFFLSDLTNTFKDVIDKTIVNDLYRAVGKSSNIGSVLTDVLVNGKYLKSIGRQKTTQSLGKLVPEDIRNPEKRHTGKRNREIEEISDNSISDNSVLEDSISDSSISDDPISDNSISDSILDNPISMPVSLKSGGKILKRLEAYGKKVKKVKDILKLELYVNSIISRLEPFEQEGVWSIVRTVTEPFLANIESNTELSEDKLERILDFILQSQT